jgi:hypothetical protein
MGNNREQQAKGADSSPSLGTEAKDMMKKGSQCSWFEIKNCAHTTL